MEKETEKSAGALDSLQTTVIGKGQILQLSREFLCGANYCSLKNLND